MIDPEKLRLATDPLTPLSAEQQRHWAATSPRTDLLEVYGVSTHSGGRLKLTPENGTVTLAVDRMGDHAFAVRFRDTDLKKFISEGGSQNLPGVGTLVATPRGHDSVRLCLVAEKNGRCKGAQGILFVADICVSEVLKRL